MLPGPSDSNRGPWFKLWYHDKDYALKQQRIIKEGGREKTSKASKGRGQITVVEAVRILIKMTGDKKQNYLIHTNCMYSLVVNFDKEESSKWERTKIEVTKKTNIIMQHSMTWRRTGHLCSFKGDSH